MGRGGWVWEEEKRGRSRGSAAGVAWRMSVHSCCWCWSGSQACLAVQRQLIGRPAVPKEAFSKQDPVKMNKC